MLRVRDHPRRAADPVLRLQLGRLSRPGAEGVIEASLKEACASAYASPAVRWLLGGELHPGGEETTRRALDLIAIRRGERMLDVASGAGASAMLAAREHGCLVTGVEYGDTAVAEAMRVAEAAGLRDRVAFVAGDAEALPFEDGQFDAVLCECSLCVFEDKPRALAEIRRVLRPDGRLALADVVVDGWRRSPMLDDALATVACIGEALSVDGYLDLLARSGLHPTSVESRDEDAAALADRVLDRLRGARVLGVDRVQGSPISSDEAIELVREARRAIDEGTLGYTIIAASR